VCDNLELKNTSYAVKVIKSEYKTLIKESNGKEFLYIHRKGVIKLLTKSRKKGPEKFVD
jgi:prophage antirepressor-like protein